MRRENMVKAKWRRGEPAFGAWLSIPSAFSAEVMNRQGFDYICIDMQHGLADFPTVLAMLQAMGMSGAMPFVRVPSNDFAIINRVLDAGAMGIIVPMVNTPGEARAAVSACRYAPVGSRSYGPTRVSQAYGADYFEWANDEVACVVMVETQQALDHLDEILAVPGFDAIYVGPQDLSLTLGMAPRVDNEGVFEEARLRIVAACREHGVAAGMHANASLAKKHVAAGYRMVTISSDHRMLVSGSEADLRTAREP